MKCCCLLANIGILLVLMLSPGALLVFGNMVFHDRRGLLDNIEACRRMNAFVGNCMRFMDKTTVWVVIFRWMFGENWCS